jgi:adenosylcobinamide-GDP ribazoletransferase
LEELRAAFMLLTRLPIGIIRGAVPDPARCVWAYPLVGIAVGAIGAAAWWVAHALFVPDWVAAFWTVAAMLLATGALHEDGLADTMDGLGGGRTRERRLEIMRDSRIGSFGALALIISLGIRAGAIAAMFRPGPVAAALIAASAIGRGGILLLLLTLHPARADGLGAALTNVQAGRICAGLAVAVLAALAVLPFGVALISLVLGAISAMAMSGLAAVQLGGYTGDVLGAASVVTECVVLTVIAAVLP